MSYRGPVTKEYVSADFEQFVARHFGARGRAWLDQLPRQVERHTREWGLEVEGFLPGGLMSCCLVVTTTEGEAAVLKLGGPWTPASSEGAALAAWDGGPAPKLLRIDAKGNALLLERIRPATPFITPHGRGGLDRLAELLSALHAPALSAEMERRLPPLENVVYRLIDTAGAEAAARSAADATELQPRLALARTRAADLLSHPEAPTLLHGDLENKNILHCNRRGLVAIDPLPCIGDPTYDAAYWLGLAVQVERRDTVARELAAALSLDPTRLRTWAAVVALEP